VNTILSDKTEDKRISIRPFFTETADNGATMKAMVKAVIASLRAEKKKRDTSETATDEWFKSVEPSLLKIGAVTLAPSTEAGKSSGLTFHYPPIRGRPLRRGRICRLRAVGNAEHPSHGGRHAHLRRRAAEGRRGGAAVMMF
jgi:hypothetical protein